MSPMVAIKLACVVWRGDGLRERKGMRLDAEKRQACQAALEMGVGTGVTSRSGDHCTGCEAVT